MKHPAKADAAKADAGTSDADPNRDPDQFFARPQRWQAELIALRAILLSCDLVEVWKWSSPVYTFGGGNVAIVWGFKDRATLGFFKGVLLPDPDGILVPPGDNSRSSRVVNLTSLAQVRAMEPVLRRYIAQAIQLERSGQKVDLPKDDLAPPPELQEALDADPTLAAAFHALTPGRRRSWILHLAQAKQPETRRARIAKARPAILSGKGLQNR